MRRRADTRSPAFAHRVAEARQIEHEFDGWHVWVSSVGRLWAVRQGPDARCSRDDPRPMTVDADNPDELRVVLAGIESATETAIPS